ncbi:uncharacterized protein LOC133191290 [Saccostrea echinata]|uniref:uncharacterized protein LOC133191290 n=1 Tax=Saccostrea echinata TaxID=191078 RepID=UPI002A80AFE8|nr:uncharacterized protein LOC133191290 [Saccostrea echinata]
MEQKCAVSPNVLGKRSSSVTKTRYCKKEICNADIDRFLEPSTTPCNDASASDCRDPSALLAICSDCETAQFCRKSCGLCEDHTQAGSWSENLVLFDYWPIYNKCNYSKAVGPSICNSIRAHGMNLIQVNHTTNDPRAYLNLAYPNSYIHLHFHTHGEPLTNLQLFACQTTGRGRVDVLLNNVTIEETYNRTAVWSQRWQLHKLNPAQHTNNNNYVLRILKDRHFISCGHYWLGRIRLETTVVHHGQRKRNMIK